MKIRQVAAPQGPRTNAIVSLRTMCPGAGASSESGLHCLKRFVQCRDVR